MARLAMHSPSSVLGWDLGRKLGTRWEGGGGLALHRRTSSTRSLGHRLPHFCALPVLGPFNICPSSAQSTALHLVSGVQGLVSTQHSLMPHRRNGSTHRALSLPSFLITGLLSPASQHSSPTRRFFLPFPSWSTPPGEILR